MQMYHSVFLLLFENVLIGHSFAFLKNIIWSFCQMVLIRSLL